MFTVGDTLVFKKSFELFTVTAVNDHYVSLYNERSRAVELVPLSICNSLDPKAYARISPELLTDVEEQVIKDCDPPIVSTLTGKLARSEWAGSSCLFESSLEWLDQTSRSSIKGN